MKTYKLTVEYDGTRYSGWQEQENARTVMGTLRDAIEGSIGARVEMQGAGRTDAGVHALGQVAHVRVKANLRRLPEQLAEEWNERLPTDIAVLALEEAANSFHARHDAISRSYVYQVSTRKNAFAKRHVWWVREPLDVEAMTRAAARIAGRHDFECFRAADPSKPGESSIVVVEHAAVEQHDDLILFRIEASHFLWRMVRRLAGTLVKVGKGELTEADFETLLAGKCSREWKVSEWTAPSAGLFLEAVRYE